MRDCRNRFSVWLEWLVTAALTLVAIASLSQAFRAPPLSGGQQLMSFRQLRELANKLRLEPNPVLREGNTTQGKVRLLSVKIPPGTRIFMSDFLGSQNLYHIGYYYNFGYYLFPRQVDISLGQPPLFQLDEVTGRRPASLEEVQQAGYDFAILYGRTTIAQVQALGSSLLEPPDTQPTPIPEHDWLIALLLPLLVAVAGSRVVRWLFRELEGVLSTGELLASGLAVGAFLLTQLTLGLRLAGFRWERALLVILMLWTAGEGVVWIRRWRPRHPQFKVCHLWWLLLAPAALILWCQFRLAGLLGLQEFDAIAIWAFKAKILNHFAGQDLWTWFRNPGLAYAHMDYPLLVPLLHALTWGALGHMNDFVTKFWSQWMLLFLACAVLGAGRFPHNRPWLAGAAVVVMVLLLMTRLYALMEGPTIPMMFYVVLSSMQLAIGMVEKQTGRLRLGLLLLMAAAMVKFEGVMLLGLWVVVLLLDRDSRAAFWPLSRVGLAGLVGTAAWLPYVVFRLNGPVSHPESGWLALLFQNPGSVLHILPMTLLAMLSRRFVSNDISAWSSPDNQHVVWQGHWAGWQSLVEPWTQGMGWVCLLLLVTACYRGGRLRGAMFRLCIVFFALATVVSLVWSATRSDPISYTAVLGLGEAATGGRHLYPALMSWFVAGVILLLRELPGESGDSNEREE